MSFKKVHTRTNWIQQDCICTANHLIELCHLPFKKVSAIQEINSRFIVALFESITSYRIPDLFPSGDTIADVHNVQSVIDTLSLDLLGLSLSHISGENVISGDPVAVLNLLEILEAVFLHLFSQKESIALGNKVYGTVPKKKKMSSTSHSSTIKSSVASVENEVIPAVKVLKRKTCRKTLKNHRDDAPEASETTSDNSPASLPVRTIDAETQKLNIQQFVLSNQNPCKVDTNKKKTSETCDKMAKRLSTRNVELLFDSNLEKKIQSLLLGRHSPQLRSQQLKRNYRQSLRTPLKRKSIPCCKKSFLLPHPLRPIKRTKDSFKTRRRVMKEPISEQRDTSKVQGKSGSENDVPALIQCLMEEFPGFEFPESTLGLLTKHYHHHLSHMQKQLKGALLKKPTALKQAEQAVEKQSTLSSILAKDLNQKHHLCVVREQKALENKIKYRLRDARLRSTKMKQYFDIYHRSMHKKLQQRNFTEELIIEKTFKKILELKREKVRLLCQRTKEMDAHDAELYRQYLQSLQNTYEKQLDLLTESLTAEQKEAEEQEKAQNRVSQEMSQKLRHQLQADVRSLQEDILSLMRDTHFRELDAANFIDYMSQQEMGH